MAEGLANAKAKLTELGRKSFLVQMRAEGETTWQSLNNRAAELQGNVEEIEKDLSGPNAWQALSKAEAEANDDVFNEKHRAAGRYRIARRAPGCGHLRTCRRAYSID